MIGGLAVASGPSFLGAVTAITVGTMMAMVFYVVMATIGVDYGIPGQVATRMTYGLRGANMFPRCFGPSPPPTGSHFRPWPDRSRW